MKVWMTERISPATAREMGVWFALLMLLAFHFFEGGLQNRHVFVSVFGGVGFWAAFRYLPLALNQERR